MLCVDYIKSACRKLFTDQVVTGFRPLPALPHTKQVMSLGNAINYEKIYSAKFLIPIGVEISMLLIGRLLQLTLTIPKVRGGWIPASRLCIALL